MPKLWNQTIETHRAAVQEAIMHAAAALAGERGLRSVTMSEVADRAGIGRATLYKYFPDVGSILLAWHDRRINAHLEHLAEARDRAVGPEERLEGVLHAYALIVRETRGHAGSELAEFLHSDGQVGHARLRLRDMIRGVLEEGMAAGCWRRDAGADELAAYCLHSLSAAAELPSKAEVRKLVSVVVDGLKPRPGAD